MHIYFLQMIFKYAIRLGKLLIYTNMYVVGIGGQVLNVREEKIVKMITLKSPLDMAF